LKWQLSLDLQSNFLFYNEKLLVDQLHVKSSAEKCYPGWGGRRIQCAPRSTGLGFQLGETFESLKIKQENLMSSQQIYEQEFGVIKCGHRNIANYWFLLNVTELENERLHSWEMIL
jgi:hypothetical protein